LLHHYRKALREIRIQSEKITYPYDPTAEEGWDTDTFAEFIDRHHPDLKAFFELQLKVTAGDLINKISSFWGIVTVDWNIKANFFWLAGGSSGIPHSMSAALGNRLWLDSDVLSIESNGVTRVKYKKRGIVGDLFARSVILAIPPSEVLNITKLPCWKREAMEQVRFGAYIPVHLCYRNRFWEGKIKGGYLNCAGTVFADLVDGTY